MPLLEISKRLERLEKDKRQIRERLEKDGAMADGLKYTNKAARERARDTKRDILE